MNGKLWGDDIIDSLIVHIHTNWSRNVSWNLRNFKVSDNFLIFQPIFIRFSLFYSQIFTPSYEIKLNLFRISPLTNAMYAIILFIEAFCLFVLYRTKWYTKLQHGGNIILFTCYLLFSGLTMFYTISAKRHVLFKGPMNCKCMLTCVDL